MARGAGQKGKLLALERIFWEQTDEAHPLSIPRLMALLQERGVQIRQRLAAQMLPVRWMVYFGLLFAFIIFGAYGGNFTNTAFIYGEF